MNKHPELQNERHVHESREQRIRRKARQLRRALIEGGIVVSPDPDTLFENLPESRQTKWLSLAAAYVDLF